MSRRIDSGAVASLCRSCDGVEPGFPATLRRALGGLPVTVRLTECMSGCALGPTLAFRAPGKTAYLFGPVGSADLADILTFAGLYLASPDGTIADARPLGGLRAKAIARIPG